MVLPYAESLDLRKGLSLGAFLQGLSMLVHAFVGLDHKTQHLKAQRHTAAGQKSRQWGFLLLTTMLSEQVSISIIT